MDTTQADRRTGGGPIRSVLGHSVRSPPAACRVIGTIGDAARYDARLAFDGCLDWEEQQDDPTHPRGVFREAA